ncbi:MAG: protein kinase [Polyangiaceae bacterium]
MPGKVTLRAVAGPLTGKAFEFVETDTFVFGRGTDCHGKIPEADGFASRYHFLLEVSPPQARIKDLGSLNGTIVNGQKRGGRDAHETPEQGAKREFPKVELRSGDQIDVGDTRFVVEIEAPVPPSVAVAPTVLRVAEAAPAPEPPMDDRQANRRIQQIVQDLLEKAAPNRPRDAPEIPGYALEKQLGAGGMGAVFLARRLRDGHPFAVKVMLPRVATDPQRIKDFIREASVAIQLKHPNIAETYELGQAGNLLYMIMEFCECGDVDGLMEKFGGRLPLSAAAPLMLQALDALEHAHTAPITVKLASGEERRERGVVHRDLKPQNILLRGSFERPTVKLSDYGLAKCFNTAGLSGHTATGVVAGTPCFMPREQIIDFKHVKPASDVWAMGATFYNMLTGSVPLDFPADTDPIAVILQGRIVPARTRNPSLDPRVASVIDHSLEPDPSKRFHTAAEFRRALAGVL